MTYYGSNAACRRRPVDPWPAAPVSDAWVVYVPCIVPVAVHSRARREPLGQPAAPGTGRHRRRFRTLIDILLGRTR